MSVILAHQPTCCGRLPSEFCSNHYDSWHDSWRFKLPIGAHGGATSGAKALTPWHVLISGTIRVLSVHGNRRAQRG